MQGVIRFLKKQRFMTSMYKNQKVLLMMPAYNDAGNVGKVIENIPKAYVDEVVIVNDGSRDNTEEEIKQGLKKLGFGTLINFEKNKGLGPGFKEMFSYAKKKKFDVGVIVAGDNQDDPREMIKLLDALLVEKNDMIQGSRYLSKEMEPIPIQRIITTKLYSFVFSLFVRKKITDASNGFKAFRIELLDKIDLTESWLDDKYGIEQYFLAKVIREGYKVKEVPVKKYYPPNYSKMRMSVDWWKLIKPLLMSLRKEKKRV